MFNSDKTERSVTRKPRFPFKILFGVFAVGLITALGFLGSGINNDGNRTVVQYPWGGVNIKFTPGWYLTFFGKETVYRDEITFGFDESEKGQTGTLTQNGVNVRYQDGGLGTVYGIVRYQLPKDEVTMRALHKAFRSNSAVAEKLLKPTVEESMQMTAGLLSSEAAYAEQRAQFKDWASSQVKNGNFKTRLKYITEKDEVTGKTVSRKVPEIMYDESNRPMHSNGELKQYGVTVSSFKITDWDFEQKTLDQISAKREATMAIITAKANAERAKQDAITAEEQGKAKVVAAKYEKEQEKIRAVVDAEKAKEVAVIQAQKLVDVAEQIKLEAEQKKLAAVEYKEEQILRGDGDAYYKQAVIEADGALQQKLDTYERVMGRFATEFGKQKWVPEMTFGSAEGTNNGGDSVQRMIDLLTVETAKKLNVDTSIK